MLAHLVVFFCVSAPSQDQGTPATPDSTRIDKAIKAFRAMPRRERPKILAAVRAAVDAVDHPYLQSVRAYIEKGDAPRLPPGR